MQKEREHALKRNKFFGVVWASQGHSTQEVTTALAAYVGHAHEREADLPKYLFRGATDS